MLHEFLTRRVILAVQKDAKGPKDHMMHSSTLEIFQSTPVDLHPDLFHPTAPTDAAWIFQVNPDGTNMTVADPMHRRNRTRH